MIIYKITNTINGLIYIGQTTQDMDKRWRNHCNPRSFCRYLKHAIQKYGKENFCIEEIAAYKNMQDLNNAEEYFIDHYNCLVPQGYNLDSGGGNKITHSETRTKISLANKGKRKPPRTLTHSKNISLGKIGKPTNIDYSKTLPGIHKQLRKAVINTNMGIIYSSATEAEKQTGVLRSGICQVVKGKRSKAGGFNWKYA